MFEVCQKKLKVKSFLLTRRKNKLKNFVIKNYLSIFSSNFRRIFKLPLEKYITGKSPSLKRALLSRVTLRELALHISIRIFSVPSKLWGLTNLDYLLLASLTQNGTSIFAVLKSTICIPKYIFKLFSVQKASPTLIFL